MAVQLGATRDAFLAANVPADKASATAEELANYERLAGVARKLAVLMAIVAANTTLICIGLGGTFAIWSKLADLSARIAHIPH